MSQLTEDIKEHHQLELVLDIAKVDSSTQDNLEKHEGQCVQDLKNEKASETISSVLKYLITHHGSPATVEFLAKTRHEDIGKLVRPFLEGNIALCFAAIKGHRSARIYLNFPTGKLFGKLSFIKICGGNDVKKSS